MSKNLKNKISVRSFSLFINQIGIKVKSTVEINRILMDILYTVFLN